VRKVFDLRLALGSNHVDGTLDEIAHHGLDVAPDVSDFGELRRFDLHERRAGEFGQTAGDLCLSDAGWPDENDVVGRDLLADRFRRALPPPPVAHCDRH
jgi:hypothetical protein